MPIKFFVGNTLPVFTFTVKDEDGNVVDLSSPDLTSVKCHIRADGADANKFTGAEEDATIEDKPTGRIDYTLPSGGIDTAGSYTAQLELTFGSDVQESERFQFRVEDGLK